ncbi:hypothetical protein [Streptomyces corynorhini]|uniref:Uncharacterized protein n=1 Tax=Streptomyces corynorhini TaxID=2282652 RepID=A0A370B8A0_9ACTN|nr:hypothetical protein [Streptomyces corynorhini]RDG37841.1 hypothetical protein DVH02_12325 [Streptomyces corynorhini]
MKPGAEATIHQLLGRITYFHTLFVEPTLVSVGPPVSGETCCNHQDTTEPGQPDVGTLLGDTAWTVLDEIARTLGKHLRPCPKADARCCATCRVAASGAAIAQAWMATEHHAYHRPPPENRLRQACRTTATARLAHVFAWQYGMNCHALAKAEAADAYSLPKSSELPLTGELLALWQDPLAATGSPVVSWLNHCTDLNDIHRVLQQRGTTK